MRHKQREWLDLIECILAVLIILSSIVLFLYWKTSKLTFVVEFLLAAALLGVLGVDSAIGDPRKPRFGAAVAYFLFTAIMIGFATAAILVARSL